MIIRLLVWLVGDVRQLWALLASTFPPVILDGSLYVSAAVFGYLQTAYGSDEAYKYVAPEVVWDMKLWSGAILAASGSLKIFRSTAYAEYLKDKGGKGGK